jgi:hypothetical protein
MNELPAQRRGLVNGVIRFCLEQKLVVAIVTIAVIFWGVLVAPFDWQIEGVPRSPVPVDAIPDIGENQQIVFTEWPGRSPQDIDDQISYPLTVALLGIPGVKDIRSYSIFGFSTIYVVFDDDIEHRVLLVPISRVGEAELAAGGHASDRHHADAWPGRHGARTGVLVHARGARL